MVHHGNQLCGWLYLQRAQIEEKLVNDFTSVLNQSLEMHLVISSESIETISLSAAKRFTDGKETTSSFVTKYKNRDAQLDLSLHQYFNLLIKKTLTKKIEPQYVGGSGQHTYFVTKEYARAE